MNEDIVAFFAVFATLIGVPVLLVLSWRGWHHRTRFDLPEWRNGFGFTSLALLLLVLASCLGCHRHKEPVSVYVCMAGNGANFQTINGRLDALARTRPQTASGQPIDVRGVYPSREEFARFVATVRPVDIIVCDSPQKLAELAAIPELQQAAKRTSNACGEKGNCPALIAPWVPPNKQEGVQQVLRAITRN